MSGEGVQRGQRLPRFLSEQEETRQYVHLRGPGYWQDGRVVPDTAETRGELSHYSVSTL